MSERAHIRLWSSLVATVGLSIAILAVSPSAAAKWAPAEPCVSPSGLTLKQQYGYSVAVDRKSVV